MGRFHRIVYVCPMQSKESLEMEGGAEEEVVRMRAHPKDWICHWYLTKQGVINQSSQMVMK